MKNQVYNTMWLFLAPFAWAMLHNIAAALRGRGYDCEVFDDNGDAGQEMNYRVLLSRDGERVGTVEFRLYNGMVQHQEGAAIGFCCFGPEGQLGHRYAPEAFSLKAYTTHLPTLRERIEQLPLQAFVAAIDADCVHWHERAVAA